MQHLNATKIVLQITAFFLVLFVVIGTKNGFRLTRISVRPTPVDNVGETLEEQHRNNCTDILCTEYLTNETGLKDFNQCKKKLDCFDFAFVDNETCASGNCRFMDPTNRGPVGLVSPPGSGNTWVRQLLQQATGICTGAVYCDHSLRVAGFDGENVRSGAVIVVKDHYDSPLLSRSCNAKKDHNICYDSAILIVRNPFDSIVAEYNRQAGQNKHSSNPHTYVTSADAFGNNKQWEQTVQNQGNRWGKMFNWLYRSTDKNPVLLVKYEDLKNDVVHELKRMLDFLSYPYKDSELRVQMNQTISSQLRLKKIPNSDCYTQSQTSFLNKKIKIASEQLRKEFSSSFGIEVYIH